jgi:hypothetical protein
VEQVPSDKNRKEKNRKTFKELAFSLSFSLLVAKVPLKRPAQLPQARWLWA